MSLYSHARFATAIAWLVALGVTTADAAAAISPTAGIPQSPSALPALALSVAVCVTLTRALGNGFDRVCRALTGNRKELSIIRNEQLGLVSFGEELRAAREHHTRPHRPTAHWNGAEWKDVGTGRPPGQFGRTS